MGFIKFSYMYHCTLLVPTPNTPLLISLVWEELNLMCFVDSFLYSQYLECSVSKIAMDIELAWDTENKAKLNLNCCTCYSVPVDCKA